MIGSALCPEGTREETSLESVNYVLSVLAADPEMWGGRRAKLSIQEDQRQSIPKMDIDVDTNIDSIIN